MQQYRPPIRRRVTNKDTTLSRGNWFQRDIPVDLFGFMVRASKAITDQVTTPDKHSLLAFSQKQLVCHAAA
jgi:hypothetical protein